MIYVIGSLVGTERVLVRFNKHIIVLQYMRTAIQYMYGHRVGQFTQCIRDAVLGTGGACSWHATQVSRHVLGVYFVIDQYHYQHRLDLQVQPVAVASALTAVVYCMRIPYKAVRRYRQGVAVGV